MNVRTLCLAILNMEESTGYEIRKLSTEGHFSYFVDASFGSIYPALTKLESEGLVTSREETQTGKPSKKVYSITLAGRQEFLVALGNPIQKDIFKSEFLLVTMYAQYITREELSTALDSQIAYLETDLAVIDDAIEGVELAGAHWIAELGRNCMEAQLNYINKNRKQLEDLAGTSLPDNSPNIAAE